MIPENKSRPAFKPTGFGECCDDNQRFAQGQGSRRVVSATGSTSRKIDTAIIVKPLQAKSRVADRGTRSIVSVTDHALRSAMQ
jgi:hypothetical protein